MTENNLILNRLFTQNVFFDMIDTNDNTTYGAVIQRFVNDYENKDNGALISEVYRFMSKSYRNEYFYQNTLLNKLLLGKHSINTTTALTQIPISKSKADFILINGKAVVYEIKTALDNFDRLDGQIEDYYKAFSRVVVVTSEKNFDSVQQKLQNSPTGICLLTKKGTLSVRKEPIEYGDMLSKTIMFKILRKNEYEQILLKHFGLLPDVSQFEYYRECQAMFESLPTDIAYQMFVQALKSRAKIDVVEYSKIPYELKFLIYFSNYKKSDYAKLCRFLST